MLWVSNHVEMHPDDLERLRSIATTEQVVGFMAQSMPGIAQNVLGKTGKVICRVHKATAVRHALGYTVVTVNAEENPLLSTVWISKMWIESILGSGFLANQLDERDALGLLIGALCVTKIYGPKSGSYYLSHIELWDVPSDPHIEFAKSVGQLRYIVASWLLTQPNLEITGWRDMFSVGLAPYEEVARFLETDGANVLSRLAEAIFQ